MLKNVNEHLHSQANSSSSRCFVNFLLIYFLFFLSFSGFSQTKTLSPKEFLNIILSSHPIIKQGKNLNAMAQSELLYRRGQLEPKLLVDYTLKEYTSKNYFNYFDLGLKIPTWYGVDVEFGYENNEGIFINPSNFTPPGGLGYVGLKIPIGQGMIIDERRSSIRQAKYMALINENERVKIINKMVFSAFKDYLDWAFFYKKYFLVKTSYTFANDLYLASKERINQGDLAAIDSTEALLKLQEAWLELQDAQNDYQNSQLAVSNHLWTSQYEPLELDSNTIPLSDTSLININDNDFKQIYQTAIISHPELLKNDNKLKQMAIEKSFAVNQLAPNFDINFKYLTSKSTNYLGEANWDYLSNNYKVTFNWVQPLLLRKERSKLQMAKIKLDQINIEQTLLKREISNRLNSSYNDVSTYRILIKINDKTRILATQLRDAENEKFKQGESTIFLLNSRETKRIATEIKLEDMLRKYEKSKWQLLYDAGIYEVR